MPFQPRAASVLAVGLMLTAAGCSHVTPLGPAAEVPRPQQLRSPIVLQAMRVQASPPGGGCPAGFTTLSAPVQGPACYQPLGAPATITSAAVSPGPVSAPVGHPGASPSSYELLIALPAAERAELSTVTTKAYDAQGAVDISVAGKTWALPMQAAPLTQGQFAIALPSRNELLQLQRTLGAVG